MKALRFVGKKGCSDPAYVEGLDAPEIAVIDTLPNGQNVTVSFKLDGKPVHLRLDEHTRDFLDVAAAVFVADELSARADAPDGWTRGFNFTFPVADPERWTNNSGLLERTLRILSGDSFSFSWPARARLPAVPKRKKRLPSGFDVVCLFSGGMDSLFGAYELLKAGKKVLLVGHQADTITASAQTAIAGKLADLFPGAVQLIQARVARNQGRQHRYDLPTKCEDSHRPRSFLFLSLAVVVAVATRIKQIVIPENGLIALNSPLQTSRLGTLSTRTAHPRYLLSFLGWVHQLGIYDGALNSPFMFHSKTDLAELVDETVAPLVLRSVSCAHAGHLRYRAKKNVRHCGYCVPCIYRRAMMIEAALDSPKHYAANVFTGLSKLTRRTQADVRALVQFARRVTRASPAERESMVLAHGFFPPSVAAHIGPQPATDFSPWAGMLSQWAEDFLQKVTDHSVVSTRRILGISTARKAKA